MSIAILIAVFAAGTIPEAIILKRKSKMKELYIFLGLMAAAFVLSMLVVSGAKVPSVNKIIGDWILEMTEG